jgi:hypothetical protein
MTREPSERGGDPWTGAARVDAGHRRPDPGRNGDPAGELSNSPAPPEQALDQGLFHVEKLYNSGCPDSLPEPENPSSPCSRMEFSGDGMKLAWSSLLRNLPGNDRRKLTMGSQEEKSTP